jgi:hypothetical protein
MRGEHTMKRLAVILGVAAAMGVTPSVAAAASSAQPVKPALFKPMPVKPVLAKRLGLKALTFSSLKVARQPAVELTLQTSYDDRSGSTLYRLGNTGLWME